MKRSLAMTIIVLAFALVSHTTAQEANGVQLELGPEGKALTTTAGKQTYLASDGDYVVMSEFYGLTLNKQKVACYDWNHQKLGEAEIGKEEDGFCFMAHATSDRANLLRFKSDNNSCRVFLDKRSMPTLSPLEEVTLMEGEGIKGDSYWMSTGVSNNGQLVAVAMTVVRKGIGAKTQVQLYSRDFEELYWSMTVENEAPTTLLVTDSGEVVTSYLTVDAGRASHCTVLDGENINTHRFKLETDQTVHEGYLASYVNGNIVIVLTTRNPKDRINATFDRVTFYGIDTKNDGMIVCAHDITDEEYCILMNKKLTKQKKHNLRFGNVAQVLHDESGAYVVLDCSWTVVQNNIPTDFNRTGMVVIHTDTLGRVKWVYDKRMSITTNSSHAIMAGYGWLPTTEGIMLVAPVKEKNYYLPIEKPYKKYTPTAHSSVLNVVHLSREGKELLEVGLPIKRNGLIDRPKRLADGSYLLMMRGFGSSCFAHLKLQ